LRREADALKEIKGAFGTEAFAEKVFEKVFNEDIRRLVGMKDMWKSRKAPVPLSWGDWDAEGGTPAAVDDQGIWELRENIAVFKDRYQTPDPTVDFPRVFRWELTR